MQMVEWMCYDANAYAYEITNQKSDENEMGG